MTDWTQQDARQTPVDSDKCLFCKTPRSDWNDDVTPVSVGGGEVLCSNCLGDLRMYNRYQMVMSFASGGFGPDAKQIIQQHFEQAREELVEKHPDDAAMFPVATTRSDAEGRYQVETNSDESETTD